ncbi:hypothetical protein IT568_09880 [bacterium]|nr:hypothetical protein [bacterium]
MTADEFINHLKDKTLPDSIIFYSENKFAWENIFDNFKIDSFAIKIDEESVWKDSTAYLGYWITFYQDFETRFDRTFNVYFQTKKNGNFLVPGSIKLGLPSREMILKLAGSQMFLSEKYDFLKVGQLATQVAKLFEKDVDEFSKKLPEMSEGFRSQLQTYCKWGRRTSKVVEISRGKINSSAIYKLGVNDSFYLNLYFVTISLYNLGITDDEFEGVLQFAIRDVFRTNKIEFVEAAGNIVRRKE